MIFPVQWEWLGCSWEVGRGLAAAGERRLYQALLSHLTIGMHLNPRSLIFAGALLLWSCAPLLAAQPPVYSVPGLSGAIAVSSAEPLAITPAETARIHEARRLESTRVGQLIERFTYVAIFGVLLLCSMGLPLPEEIPVLTAGVLASSGHLRPGWALGTCLVGIMAGDSFIYYLGHRWGPRVLEHRMAKKLLTVDRQQKIMQYFQRYGARIIFVARFLPGIRAPLFLTVGIMRVPYWLFFAMNGSAALLSIPLCFWIGYYFTDKMEEILNLRDRAHYWGLGLVAVGLVLWLIIHYGWRRRSTN